MPFDTLEWLKCKRLTALKAGGRQDRGGRGHGGAGPVGAGRLCAHLPGRCGRSVSAVPGRQGYHQKGPQTGQLKQPSLGLQHLDFGGTQFSP